MLLPPSLIVIGEYVRETRTEVTLIDKDANLPQTYPNIAFSSLPGKAVVKIPNTEKNYKLTANHD